MVDAPAPSSAPRPDSPAAGNRVELGILVLQQLDHELTDAVRAAIRHMRDTLRATFPEFEWQLPLVRRSGAAPVNRVEPANVLFEAIAERDIRHWDYAIAITPVELRSYSRSQALAVPSKAMNVAALSTTRLVPEEGRADSGSRMSGLAQRISALGLHLLADLNGVPHSDDPEAFTYCPRRVEDLDRMQHYRPDDVADLQQQLREVADARLEERIPGRGQSALAFYAQAIAITRSEIFDAVVRARPWEFPVRLSRFTAAAMGTSAILAVTAETWELGLRQSTWIVAVLPCAAIFAACLLIAAHHRLFLRRSRLLTEQAVLSNVSMLAVLVLGVAVTYALLWTLLFVAGLLLFHDTIVASWTGSSPTVGDRAGLAAFLASLGIVIGALGATLEGQDYFRHVIFADEEL